MGHTITLRLDDNTYRTFRKYAEEENRSLSNFIETAAKHYIEEVEFADEFEMAEIRGNAELNRSLKRAYRDAGQMKGQFVD